MNAHKWVVLSLDIADDSTETWWRCVGCGLHETEPTEGECPALAMDLGGAA